MTVLYQALTVLYLALTVLYLALTVLYLALTVLNLAGGASTGPFLLLSGLKYAGKSVLLAQLVARAVDGVLVRIHFVIVMIRWTGLAPWEFELPFPGSLTSTFLASAKSHHRKSVLLAQLVARAVDGVLPLGPYHMTRGRCFFMSEVPL